MMTKGAMTKIGKRLDEARSVRAAADREIDVLRLLYDTLHVNGAADTNLTVILDVLREDES